ncbi:hypothetical protein Leryth_012001 [Lithospermum erythrorhizon]|nr:hypothetical protein Leryth_012001 [Lithospermum erythrorhizon]
MMIVRRGTVEATIKKVVKKSKTGFLPIANVKHQMECQREKKERLDIEGRRWQLWLVLVVVLMGCISEQEGGHTCTVAPPTGVGGVYGQMVQVEDMVMEGLIDVLRWLGGHVKIV